MQSSLKKPLLSNNSSVHAPISSCNIHPSATFHPKCECCGHKMGGGSSWPSLCSVSRGRKRGVLLEKVRHADSAGDRSTRLWPSLYVEVHTVSHSSKLWYCGLAELRNVWCKYIAALFCKGSGKELQFGNNKKLVIYCFKNVTFIVNSKVRNLISKGSKLH